jgi:hypothetical protein
LPQCERIPINDQKQGNARGVLKRVQVVRLTRTQNTFFNMKLKGPSRKTKSLKTNLAEIYTDARIILKTQMEICQVVTVRSFVFW